MEVERDEDSLGAEAEIGILSLVHPEGLEGV